MVYGEFGVYPLEVDIITRMISYWTRLIEPDTMKFSNLFYKFLFYSTSKKKSAWLEYIKRIVENCGFSGIWAAQRVENTRWFVQSKRFVCNRVVLYCYQQFFMYELPTLQGKYCFRTLFIKSAL